MVSEKLRQAPSVQFTGYATQFLRLLRAFLFVVLLNDIIKEFPDGVEVSSPRVVLLGDLWQHVAHFVAKLRQLQGKK